MGWLSFPWFAILTLLTKLSIFKGTAPKARHAAGLPQAGRQAPPFTYGAMREPEPQSDGMPMRFGSKFSTEAWPQ